MVSDNEQKQELAEKTPVNHFARLFVGACFLKIQWSSFMMKFMGLKEFARFIQYSNVYN
jgi:hypothetical protein